MADIGQSPFLQSLGWATLNSFWQWAALWCLFLCVQYIFRPSSQRKYLWAVAFMGLGVLWFLTTFYNHYQSGTVEASFIAHQSWAPDTLTWNIILTSASITYLLLFIFPVYRFYKNWQYIKQVRNYGLHKANYEYRLFVKKVSALLGIKKNVVLYISDLVTSPITVGYLKPIILLPIAALNNLSAKQTEAILLHELSHIKRYDYLVNMVITFVSTVFYFNPFIKKFISVIEAEREACCDDLVLQFEYDRISYASALFLLEQNNNTMELLTIAAAQKKHLLTRIKKIVGIKEKKVFTLNHFAGLCASFLLVLVLNTLFIASNNKVKGLETALSPLESSFYAFTNNDSKTSQDESGDLLKIKAPIHHFVLHNKQRIALTIPDNEAQLLIPTLTEYDNKDLVNVALDDVEASVTDEQKEHIKSTLSATKKVLTTLQWKEVEKSIADGMTTEEKVIAKEEYLQELEKVNWNNLESNLKASYNDIDWEKVNSNLGNALITIKLDSVQQAYSTLMAQIDKAQKVSTCNVEQPMPDATVSEVVKAKAKLQVRIDSLKTIRTKKVISL
ncbi:MAG TPA: M56 family metallopeptidase [Chitinophagaceae bacterium]|nr:M56 family metallopeptidase [Chitinophagaceae bacterium]